MAYSTEKAEKTVKLYSDLVSTLLDRTANREGIEEKVLELFSIAYGKMPNPEDRDEVLGVLAPRYKHLLELLVLKDNPIEYSQSLGQAVQKGLETLFVANRLSKVEEPEEDSFESEDEYKAYNELRDNKGIAVKISYYLSKWGTQEPQEPRRSRPRRR